MQSAGAVPFEIFPSWESAHISWSVARGMESSQALALGAGVHWEGSLPINFSRSLSGLEI